MQREARWKEWAGGVMGDDGNGNGDSFHRVNSLTLSRYFDYTTLSFGALRSISILLIFSAALETIFTKMEYSA